MKITKIENKKSNPILTMAFLVLSSAMMLVFNSCTKDQVVETIETVEEAVVEEVTLDNLNGKWIRIASNNPIADGMIVEMQGTSGSIIDKGGSNFSINDIKWQNITAVDNENFNHDELGSDYNYYTAKMILRSDDTLRISVGSTGAGNEQKWVREGQYTPSDPQGQATTETLPCNISEARTLTNGPATIDYIVDCVLDVTAPLIIEAGVVIQFGEDAGLGVYDDGSLSVNGSAAAPVIMRGEEATRGYWRGVHIETNKMGNSLDYLQLSDAGGNYVYCCNEDASIYLKDGQAAITNTTISNGKSYGIIATQNFEFSGYSENTITTHELAPLHLTLARIGELDGLSSSYQGNDEDHILVSDSGITTEITLKATDVPYQILNGTVLDVQDRLNIEAGAEMVFEENAGLGVYDNGILNVLGTANDPVIFRGSENINGFWRGIHTETNSSSNIIRYAEIRNAGSNYVYCCNVSAALFIKDGQMTVENSLITESGGCGIHVNATATFTESGNDYSYNTDGDLCN